MITRSHDHRIAPLTYALLFVALLLGMATPGNVMAQMPPSGGDASMTTVVAPPVPEPAPATAPPASSAPVALPVRVLIPTINLNASVERVGLLPDNTPGTPQNYANTAWFDGSARPGETGNAVINGHVDSVNGAAVFYNLLKLKPGDYVYVVDEGGTERTFIVRAVEQYGPTNSPVERIFGTRNDGTFLNLVTCDNTTAFNRRTAEYSGYVTVYTELLPTP